MLTLATLLFAAAVLFGLILAGFHRKARGRAGPPLPLVAGHGLLALAGAGVLIATLRGPARGVATGTQSFGTIAVVVLALAILIGAGLLLSRLAGRRVDGGLVGVHASVAVTGFVILLVYTLLD